MRTIICILIFFFCSLIKGQKVNPFTDLGKNTLECISGTNLIFHSAGILSSYIIITSGTDYRIHNYFAENGYSSLLDPAVGLGYLAPVVVGGGLYFYGKQSNNLKVAAAGSAVLQAGLISLVYSSFLKAVTGRINPVEGIHSSSDESKIFHFGFLNNGIHFGWPSGHLCTNTAVVTSLISFYRESLPIKIAGYTFLAYIFYGVIAHDNNTMHWFSDVFAGTLMGYAIGATIGKNFRKKWDEANSNGDISNIQSSSGFHLLNFKYNDMIAVVAPIMFPHFQGINFNISF